MDLWRALGISPLTGLAIALGGLVVASCLALARLGRSRGGRSSLDLDREP